MPITTLPPAPSRADPATFADKGDAMMAALPPMVVEINGVLVEMTALEASTVEASAIAAGAAASVGATAWVSGTTYAIGEVRYSPIDFQTYRRKTAGAGTTDPSLDGTNWARLQFVQIKTAQGVTLTGAGNADIVQIVTYDSRATLRSASPVAGALALVSGLGLFRWVSGSTEFDDDETCFATASGHWLMEAAHWDLVDAYLLPMKAALEQEILVGQVAWTLTSLAATTQTSTTCTVPEAAVGDAVVVTPPNGLDARVACYGRVTATGVVTITLNNPSAASATLVSGTWKVAVIKTP